MKYRNAKYVDEGGVIDCEILHSKYGWIPYTLHPLDLDKTIDNESLLNEMRKNGDILPYVKESEEARKAKLSIMNRQTRDQKLSVEVDPLVTNPLRWGEMSEEKKSAVASYRRALLDITRHPKWPELTETDWPSLKI